jgi:imidazoleglycerol phosphate synthase glutamine amidotransferase subunit HisH
MYDKLRSYVENLFAPAPKTKKANELKEEFIANLSEKYRDLVASGKSEEEAYHTVISGIGDIDELIKSLEETQMFDPIRDRKDRQKNALIVSVSVMFILSHSSFWFTGQQVGLIPSRLFA